MANLFDFATKELSQDAFLRWLFENYDDPIIGEAANKLLVKICAFQDDEKVKKQTLETFGQWHKIDIYIKLTTTLGRKIAIFIEDKTFSNEHDNQLKRYDDSIDKEKELKSYEIYKIFYKTNLVEDEERNRINAANTINEWRMLDIKDIYDFFSDYKASKNIILSQYADYVVRLYSAVTNTKKPKSNDKMIDFLSWQAYFKNTILPELKGNGTDYICEVKKAGQYPYVILTVKKTGYGERAIPYLEIQSRECLENKFKAHLLCYGIDKVDVAQQTDLIDNIKANSQLINKMYTKKKGEENYFPKQVGVSLDHLTASTDEEFISLTQQHIDYYLLAMKDWK